MTQREIDELMMRAALDEALKAPAHGDVPVGCVIARDGDVLAAAHNTRERDADPAGHAELLAVRAAAASLGSWRLEGCTAYVTLEPCTMCAGALVLARLPRLVFAADDPKAGAVGSLYDVVRDPRLNHRMEVARGIREPEAAALLRDFFAERRRT